MKERDSKERKMQSHFVKVMKKKKREGERWQLNVGLKIFSLSHSLFFKDFQR